MIKKTRILASLIAISSPAALFAHGNHIPVPEAVHGFTHLGPALGIVGILAAGGLAWLTWRGRT